MKTTKSPLRDTRITLITSAFLFLFFLVEVRLFQIQVLAHEKYKNMAENQYQGSTILNAKRGNIISSDGYVLAGNQIDYLLYAEPKSITDTVKFSQTLSQALSEVMSLRNSGSQPKSDLYSSYNENIYKAVNKNLLWVPIERGITPDERKYLEDQKITGIGFEEEPVRFYPEGNLASHVLGFVASNGNGEKVGYFGVEGSLNEELKGKQGKITEETDAGGLPILIGSYKKIDPIQGRDVVLTINRSVQYIVERELKDGVEKYNAISGSIIVMDPYTGDVLAMANYPTYDPGNFTQNDTEIDEKTGRKLVEKRNLAISETYEPGSVIKPFTIATAIEHGLVTPETTYQDNGPVNYSGHLVDNWDGKHWGTLNIIQLLQKSNNIGAAWVGHLAGSKNLYEYFTNFGLGTRTNIDLEGEDSGILRDYNSWTDIDLATAAFGQGLSATPLQMLNGFNVFANGGYLLEPKIIEKIKEPKKDIIIPTKNVRRVISSETDKTMVYLLEQAAEGGEAKYFTLKDYKIAGKTGTAQVPEEGHYSSDKTNATFVGFLSGTRRFSMIVRLNEPKTSIYAAETAVPLWMDTALELINFFGIAPDKEPNIVSLSN